MKCHECQHENLPGAFFCVNCGSPLTLECPKCGHAIQAGQNFCGNCGHDLRNRAATYRDPSPASYTPEHLAQRILEERHLMVGERKRVTVLFADIVGSTAAIEDVDPEEAAAFLTGAVGAMMDAVHRYEGIVNELRGDGIMALFGAPIAHEDHALRACRAALEVPAAVARVSGSGAQTRVGLHTGEVFVREVGNDLSVEYQALGATVHLAARMEQMAEPGTTFVTNDVRRLVEGFIEARPVGAHDLKGVSEPVEVFALTEVLEESQWQARAARGLTTFTGRDEEMDRILTALAEVRSSRGRVVAVLGEAGVGKSRLVHEFLGCEALAGFQVLRSESSPYDVNTPYYPIKGAIHSWLGTGPGDDLVADRLETRLSSLGEDLAPILPALSALVDAPFNDSEWLGLSPERRRRNTRDAMRALVLAVATRRPLVAIVEDLHWIDGETQTVLDDMVDLAAASPILLLVTHRPEYVDAWTTKAHVKRIHLQPFDTEDAGEFLDHLMGNAPSIAELKPMIAARSEGTPLFIEEIVRALVDAGALTGERGHYVAIGEEIAPQIPDSVQAVLAARIDRLDPIDKSVLQVAAVAGATVALPLLVEVMGRAEAEILASLQHLQAREFLYEYRVLPASEFKFGHALIRDVAYSSPPIEQRRALHADMVTALERAEDTADQPTERLAYHAARGELWEEAARYTLQAADQAIDRSAFREAANFLRDATLALGKLPQDRAVVESAIDARMRLRVAETGAAGGLKRISQDLAEAGQLAESIGDKARQASAAIHFGYTANMLGDPVVAEEKSREASTLAEAMGDRHLAIEARNLRAQTYDYSGQPSRVAEQVEKDFEYLATEMRHETLGQTMIRSVVAGSHLSMSAAVMGQFDRALKYEIEVTAIAEEAGRPFDRMYVRWARGIRLDMQDQTAASVAAHQESVSIAEENDVWFMTTFAQPWLGHALLSDGRPSEALDVLDRIKAAAQRVELPYTEALSRAFASQAAQMIGDHELARREGRAALAFHERFPNPLLELAALTGLGRIGDAEGAGLLRDAAVLAERLRYQPWLARLRYDLGEYAAAATLFTEMGLTRWAKQALAGQDASG